MDSKGVDIVDKTEDLKPVVPIDSRLALLQRKGESRMAGGRRRAAQHAPRVSRAQPCKSRERSRSIKTAILHLKPL
jgi:hypothetical protein